MTGSCRKQRLSVTLLSLASVLLCHHQEANAFVTKTSPSLSTTGIPSRTIANHKRKYVDHSSFSSTTTTTTKTTSSLPVSLHMIWPSRDPKGMAADFPDTKYRVLGGILATLFTWHGITANSLNPVLASSATTLAMSLWSPGLGQAAFCGSFAGMTSFGSVYSTLTAAVITATMFEMLIHRRNKWLGLGGKLSFQAFLATNLTAYLFGFAGPIQSPVPKSFAAWKGALQAAPVMYGMLCGAIGSVLTIFLREIAEFNPNRDNDLQDPVRSSAVIGVLAAMSLGVGGFLDYNGAMMVFGGAFTGMSYPSRLIKGIRPGKKHRRTPDAVSTILWFGVAGALGGLIHAMTLSLGWYTGGWGGKAGTCAFAGVALFRGLENSVYFVRKRMGWTTPYVAEEEDEAEGEVEANGTTSSSDGVNPNPLKTAEVSN
eukprot:scaffold2663_cov73-Cylindrotheca_fusiformis.AAC.4